MQKIVSISTQVEQPSDRNTKSDNEFKAKVEESSITHHQFKNVLTEVSKVEKNNGTNIEEIRVGGLQISKNELSLKELIFKGNEYYYKNKFNESI